MSYFYYYRKVLLNTVRLVAWMICIVSVLVFILILCDRLFGFNWGYPWWSALYALGLSAISLAISQGARTALRHLQR